MASAQDVGKETTRMSCKYQILSYLMLFYVPVMSCKALDGLHRMIIICFIYYSQGTCPKWKVLQLKEAETHSPTSVIDPTVESQPMRQL